MKENKITLEELKGTSSEWNEAVIVFTEDSFDEYYTETERSYKVSNKSNYFDSDKISSSLFGNCLDGIDNGVRLDIYMGEGIWSVEFCYIVK